MSQEDSAALRTEKIMGYLHQTNAIYVLIKEREFFKLQTSVYFDLIYEPFPLSCFNFGKEMISNEFHRN